MQEELNRENSGVLNGERSAIHLRSANDVLKSAGRSVKGEYARRRRKALGERLEAVVEERGASSIRRPRSNFMYAGQVSVSALSVDGGPRGVLDVKV
jgi:hypothetical protein